MEDKVQLNEQSLKTELKGYKDEPLKVLAEYIWNSFDAGAKNIHIIFDKPKEGIGSINEVTIKDDGTGWDFKDDETRFLLASSKPNIDNQNKTLPHGKLGRGRYSFIWFTDKIILKSLGKKVILNKDTSISKAEESDVTIGTEVILTNISSDMGKILDTDLLKDFLSLEFGWFVEGDKQLNIFINDEKLEYSNIIKDEYLLDRGFFSEQLQKDLGDKDIKAKIIIWDKKPKEYSKFFIFKNEQSSEVFTKTTGFNKKGDEFWHSIYIYSSMFEESDKEENFENEQQLTLEISANKKLKKKIFEEIKIELSKLRRPILKAKSKTVVSNLHTEESIPKLEEYGIYDTEGFDNLLEEAYIIAPSLFSGKGQLERLFICNTFAALLSSQDRNLIKKLLEQVYGLEQEDKDKLEELLDRTDLSNIVRTTAEIQSRLDTLTDLETLLHEYKKETLEVKHLQQLLNINPWIFGEQFRLFTNTEGALKDTLYKYAKDILEIENPEIESTSRKELDLFLVKTTVETESIRKNIVVEIKRPSITLGKKEYDQIELYAKQILLESICNDGNTLWEFYLIGDDYDGDIEEKIDSAKNHGEKYKGLTINTLDGRKKIYVRKWSDIIGVEHRYKINYLQDKLKLRIKDNSLETPNTIIENIKK